MRNPTIKDLAALVRAVKECIADDDRADEFAERPSIQLTVGANDTGGWSYQTGDNSYTGGAYFYPYWGVVAVERRSNSIELARDIKAQIEEQCP